MVRAERLVQLSLAPSKERSQPFATGPSSKEKALRCGRKERVGPTVLWGVGTSSLGGRAAVNRSYTRCSACLR